MVTGGGNVNRRPRRHSSLRDPLRLHAPVLAIDGPDAARVDGMPGAVGLV
jgi:hypothetical protein